MTTHEPASRAVDGSVPDQRTDPDEATPTTTGDLAAIAETPSAAASATTGLDVVGGQAPQADTSAWAAPAGGRDGVGGSWAAVDGLATGVAADQRAGAVVLAPDGPLEPADGQRQDDAGRLPDPPGTDDPADGADGGGPGRRGFLARLAWGHQDDPRWARPGLWLLLVATALLYLWGLGRSGWANDFYSAAAQAGSASWKAFFYGSSDAGNAITVDKPPVAMWLMSLSVRIFGLSSWSILVPEALCGVASVGLLYATVRRAFNPAAGLIAGAVLATTPVAVLMFRFNNPDALLVLLLVGAAYATLRAVERASARWLVLAGVLVGFGFLTKMLQAFLIVPVLALVYLVAAPTTWWRRVRDVLASGLALAVSGGWFVAVVALVPASDRPYIGGSQHNSLWELTFGYNGLGRLTGNETGSVGGGGARAGATAGGQTFGPPSQGGGWGQTGWGRMFNSEIGGQVAWLLPAALALLIAGLVVTARRGRTDRARAAFLVWGGWLVVTGAVFSQMQGIFHPYYTVALAPAIGALVGMGAVTLWEHRSHPAASLTLAAVTAGTTWWCARLLGRTSGWHTWLRPTVLVVGFAAAVLLIGLPRLTARAGLAVAGLALVVGLAGPTSYALATADAPHTGAIPSAGPTAAATRPGGGPGGFGGFGQGRGQGQGRGLGQGGTNGFPGFGAAGGAPTLPGGGTAGQGGTGQGGTGSQGGTGQGGGRFGGLAGGMGGGMGGLLGGTTPGADLTAAIKKNASAYRWAAATVGSENAAGYQLATRAPVMAIGGFNGTDPSPTLAQFQQYVAAGKIHYFIGGGLSGAGNGGSQSAAAIAAWVQQNFTAATVDGVTVYDLTATATATTSATTTTARAT
ncbi:glycosyltransferase family 39 protein [Frankia sp. AgB1.9]|uniref:glycosyltransferase family 39 protein n=1 Tax=unclassified Frankia TaxID=2632575 RepID=UPI0019346F14|nr:MULTISPECIES: glycosyltransferase family 39 protein [unclassified Frankia]MBL7486647.1 glycosyltransferase family 39 protein [Frankia sp. AgW1.1]MBL7553614.1 glycosyltransferase family 39 protein [Frankia sp. AgB1.9]MBL7617735.1 glycosyltransferase family 39 protein [Frankia sp. AgB1.8]